MINDRYITKTLNAMIRVREIADAKYNRIGEKCRNEVIIPFCEKYKLDYLTGHGKNWFSTASYLDIDSIDAEIISKYNRSDLLGVDADELTPNESLLVSRPAGFARDLVKAFQLLDLEVDRNCSIGDYVAEYRHRREVKEESN